MSVVEQVLLIIQLVTLLAETACFCFCLSHIFFISLVWFVICISILCATSVVTQILSLCWTHAGVGQHKYRLLVLLHVILLGLPTRYAVAGFRGLKGPQLYEAVFKQTGLLRLIYTSVCTVPLTICIFYVFWDSGRSNWIYFASSIVGVISGATSLCVLRRPSTKVNRQKDEINCAAIVLCFIWRFGELVSRVLVLVLFASLYSAWVFLVLALHWFTMFAWASIFSCARGQACSPAHLLHLCAVSYANTYAFLDTNKFRPKYARLLYYLIMSVENGTLVIVCLIYTWQQTLNVLIAMVATGAYVASLIAAGIHRLCIKSDVVKTVEINISASAEEPHDHKLVQAGGSMRTNSEHMRPLQPPKYSEIHSSVGTSMETLNTQLTKSSFTDSGVPVLIGEAPPGVPLGDKHFCSVSDPDLSLKRKRGCTRSVSQMNKKDVIRLIMRESGSTAVGDSAPNFSTLSHARRQNGRVLTSSLKGPSVTKTFKSQNLLSESESEYAWDHYDLLYSPEDIVQLDPRLLDAPIVFYKKPKLKGGDSGPNEAPQSSGQDSDYGTLNQWIAHSTQVSRTNKNRRELRKKRPTIVCGTGLHKQRRGMVHAGDALGWRRSESDISYISKSSRTTALSAPSEYMVVNNSHKEEEAGKRSEDVSVVSSQTHHSDPTSCAGIKPAVTRTPVAQLSHSPVQTGDVTSDSCLSGPKSQWSSQDDICSLYSTDISSHTTTDELKAAISEKYRIKHKRVKRSEHNLVSRKGDKTHDSVTESEERTQKPSNKKQFEAEIDSIVSAIKSPKNPEDKHRIETVHICQKSVTSDYGSLQEPELSLRAWYDFPETET